MMATFNVLLSPEVLVPQRQQKNPNEPPSPFPNPIPVDALIPNLEGEPFVRV